MFEERRELKSISKYTVLLIVACVAAVVTYVYFLNMSVVHVVVQKEVMHDIQDMRNEIALLESQYITAQHTIAERVATLDGLHAERNKLFVHRSGETGLVLNQ